MGFASYGNYKPEIRNWLEEHKFFANIWGKKSIFFNEAKKKFNININSFDQKNQFIQDVAACFQKVFEEEFISHLKKIQSKIKADYLYYSGGSALNIVCNTRILEEKLFKDIFIPPCPSDSGLSIGAGAYLEFRKHGAIKKHSAYLNNFELKVENFEIKETELDKCAKALAEDKIIAVCNNFGEAGPRALGNRSILARADSKELAQKLSVTHKRREWYRPVAPIMLEENAKYFTERESIHHLSKYMLLDFEIPETKREELAGATHSNNTARIQTIFERADNPFIYELLDYLDKNFKIKALLNTSFNAQGEPIVHTEENAIQSAKNMKLDGVIINGKLQLL
jgi:carbamoyltransferase